MSMIVTCDTCGCEFEASAEAIRAGTWQRLCPRCYPPTRATPCEAPD